MAKCEYCPKVPMYGNNRPWSEKSHSPPLESQRPEGENNGERPSRQTPTLYFLS